MITGLDVKNKSLTPLDFLGSVRGPRGPAGSAGPAGPQGPATGPAGGDLTGNYPNPSIAADAVTSAKVIDASQAAGLRKADTGAVSATVTFDPGSIAAQSCGSDSATLTGAQNGDLVIAHPVSAVWSNLMYAPWLSQTNLVSLRLCNPTASAIDGPAVSFHVLLIR